MSQEQGTSETPTPQASAPAAAAPSVASPTADSGAATTEAAAASTETVAAVAERPAWLPESFWDAEKGEAKAGDLTARLTEYDTLKAAADARTAAVPEKADGYEAKLPEDFQLPEGWELNAEDPMWAAGRDLAHKNGWTQSEFERAAQAFVGLKVAEHQMVEAGAAKVREALGENGPARIDALSNFFNSFAGDAAVAQQLRDSLFTPGIIGAWEKAMSKLTAQGVGGIGNGGGSGEQPGSIPGFATMTFEQRIQAARASRGGVA